MKHGTRWRSALVILVASLGACDASLSTDQLDMTIPEGYIGSGSTVEVSVVNGSDTHVSSGSLPCTIDVERRLDGRWEQVGALRLCTDEIELIPARGARSVMLLMPDAIGTWRLALPVNTQDVGRYVVRSRAFQTVGIVVN